MRALVLGGAGAVCEETVRDLSKFSPFSQIAIADINHQKVQQLIDELEDKRLVALPFDADDYQSMVRLFPDFDVVVNGLPYRYDYLVNKACVECGVNGLDLSSSDPQFELHHQALEEDMIFIPGVGATPGITNMMAKRAAEELDHMDEVEIAFAAFRCLAPAPGLLQTTLWEFNPEEPEREAVYYEDGTWHPSPPLSGEKTVQFHDQIGEQKVYLVPHDEVNTLPVSFPGLKRVAVRGCFPPHVMELMGVLMRNGLLSNRKVRIGDREISSLEMIRALLGSNPSSLENEVWGYGLVLEARGVKNGHRATCLYRSHHPPASEWGAKSAYFKNVGIPLSIGAILIAQGQVTRRGVLPPEVCFPTREFFEALAQRGIWIEETVIVSGILAESNHGTKLS